MTPIDRARLAVGKSCLYKMGVGTSDPASALPGVEVAGLRYCDCSDFVAWVFGQRRGDYNTDAILADTIGPHKRWRKVAAPEVGGIVVFGGTFKRLADGSRVRVKPGHVALVTEAPEPWRVSTLRVIDCSASNPMGRAIQERGAAHFEAARRRGKEIVFAIAT